MPTISISDPNRKHRIAKGFERIQRQLLDFVFPVAADNWLTILRIGLGLQLIAYCLSLRKDWNQLFAENGTGWISRSLMEVMVTVGAPLVPRLGWFISLGHKLGLAENTVLSGAWIILLVASCFIVIGFLCRTSAVTAWFAHLCAVKSGGLLTYGMDDFTTIGLFYLMLAPLPDCYSFDHKMRQFRVKDRHLHGFFRRVLQLHLCVIYFFGGIAKFLGAGWWNGESMWRALTRAPFNILPTDLIISWHFLLPAAGIAVIILETGYSFFIWWKQTRLIWLIAIVAMHIGIGVTMGLYLFASIMIVLNLAAFGPELIFGKRRCEDLLSATSR